MAVFSTIGNIIGGNKQADAAEHAADVSLDVAKENNKLAREIYGENKQTLSPFVNRGNAAGDTLNALLGLGGGTRPVENQDAIDARTENYIQYLLDNNAGKNNQIYQSKVTGDMSATDRLNLLKDNLWQKNSSKILSGLDKYQQSNPLPEAVYGPETSAQDAANDAFDTFKNSTNYQWRLNQGLNAVNSGWAGAGALQSGAAMQAISDYGQNTASNELMNYMGLLGNQQGVGLSGASALAGVGQNFANSVSANNNNAGTAQANALLAGGAAQANAWQSGGNALGQIAGIFAGGGF